MVETTDQRKRISPFGLFEPRKQKQPLEMSLSSGGWSLPMKWKSRQMPLKSLSGMLVDGQSRFIIEPSRPSGVQQRRLWVKISYD